MAKVFSTLIVLSVNFLLQKYFTFKVKAVCPVTTGPE
jgi:putative flippase GtrA